MTYIDTSKFQPFEYANEPVRLRRRVLGFLSYITRIAYKPEGYEFYWCMDNYVEVGCFNCGMPLGGLPKEQWDALPKKNDSCTDCKWEYDLS